MPRHSRFERMDNHAALFGVYPARLMLAIREIWLSAIMRAIVVPYVFPKGNLLKDRSDMQDRFALSRMKRSERNHGGIYTKNLETSSLNHDERCETIFP